MMGSFKQTLEALNNDPRIIKASGIGEERTLIIMMIEELISNKLLDNQKEFGEEIISKIQREIHRKNFDNVS